MRSNQQETSDGAAIAAEPNHLAPHFELGRLGETLAIEHLERAGYRIVAANFRLPIGRNTRDVIVNAEIDVVAYDGPTLCFVEVKTRGTDEFVDAPYRYDVVTVVSSSAKQIDREPRIELLKNFWTDEKLRKRTWREARWD